GRSGQGVLHRSAACSARCRRLFVGRRCCAAVDRDLPPRFIPAVTWWFGGSRLLPGLEVAESGEKWGTVGAEGSEGPSASPDESTCGRRRKTEVSDVLRHLHPQTRRQGAIDLAGEVPRRTRGRVDGHQGAGPLLGR